MLFRSTRSAEIVARLYGTEYVEILHLIRQLPELAAALPSDEVAAQVVYAASHEGARTLSDIVDRRLILGTVRPVGADVLGTVAALAGPLLGWDADRQREEVATEAGRRARVVAARR